MPKPTNSFLDKLLCSAFMTAYSGIGILASIGVFTAVKNNIGEEDVPEDNEKKSILGKIFVQENGQDDDTK